MKVFLLCCVLSLGLLSTMQAQEDVLRPHGSDGSGNRGSNTRSSSSSMPLSIGVDAGINYNMFSQSLNDFGFPANSPLQTLKSGTGVSPFFDVYLDLGLSKSIGLQFKVAYDIKSFGNTLNGEEICVDTLFLNGIPIGLHDTTMKVEGKHDNQVSYVGLAALVRFNITPEFFAILGPVVHFKVGDGSASITRTILSPEECRYYDADLNGDGVMDYDANGDGKIDANGVKSIKVSGTADLASTTRVGLEMGLGYKIPLSSSIDLIPKAGFQYFFTKAAKEETVPATNKESTKNATLNSLQLSIGLLFRL